MSATAPPPAPPVPPRPTPPPPNGSPRATPSNAPRSTKKFAVSEGKQCDFQRFIIYGPGGVGKTELAANIKAVGKRPLFLDIGSGTGFLDVARISGIESWDELRAALIDESIWKSFDAVVLDDLTKAEEFAVAWTLANVPRELKNGSKEYVKSVDGYGWGNGPQFVYDSFLPLLGDLDAHIRAGRQVICIAHECTSNVPNPGGEDFLRYEPRLQSPKSGKASIRHRVKEWCDHMLFIGFDVHVTPDGKAQGGGTRTIYPAELPTHWAKSRDLASPIPYERGSAELWKQVFGGNSHAAS